MGMNTELWELEATVEFFLYTMMLQLLCDATIVQEKMSVAMPRFHLRLANKAFFSYFCNHICTLYLKYVKICIIAQGKCITICA